LTQQTFPDGSNASFAPTYLSIGTGSGVHTIRMMQIRRKQTCVVKQLFRIRLWCNML